MLAAHHLARLVSYSVVASTGILLAALGLGIEALTAPVLFYLIVSALTTGTFFMLTGMTDRTRSVPSAAAPAEPPDAAGAVLRRLRRARARSATARDEDVGVAIPRAIAFFGLTFVCCVLLVTGLPPLPGFLAKFALLSTAIDAAPAGGLARGRVDARAAVVLVERLRRRRRADARRHPPVLDRHRPHDAAPAAARSRAGRVSRRAVHRARHGARAPSCAISITRPRSLHEPQDYIRTVLGEPRASARSAQP